MSVGSVIGKRVCSEDNAWDCTTSRKERGCSAMDKGPPVEGWRAAMKDPGKADRDEIGSGQSG